jgi:uncharacterized protein YoaH (UPF0181 family)
MDFTKLIEWSSKMDKETVELMKRFMAKGIATGNLNAYLKRVFKAELETLDVAGSNPSSEP